MIFIIFLLLLGFNISGMDSQSNKESQTNVPEFTLASSLSPNRDEAIQIKAALEIIEQKSIHNFGELEGKISKPILIKTLKNIVDFPFTSEQWDVLDANNVTEQIIAFKNQSSDNCFQNQSYESCSCTSAIHQPKRTDLKQHNSYNNASILPVGQKETAYRAELIDLGINPDKNGIFPITSNHDGSDVTIGKLIGTLEDHLTQKDHVTMTIASNVDPLTRKNKVVSVATQGWDSNDLKFVNFRIPTRNVHFVATSIEPTLLSTLFDEAGNTIQNTNRKTLLSHKFDKTTTLNHQIESYKNINQLITKKQKSPCSIL